MDSLNSGTTVPHEMKFNWNKIVIIFSLNWISLIYGFTHGHVAGMVGALQRGDEGIVLSELETSLIAGFLIFCFIFGFIYATVLGAMVGRKWSYVLSSVPGVVNWIVLYYGYKYTDFMISRFLAGLSVGALSMLNTSVSAEFTMQKTRTLHLIIVTIVMPALGTALGHALGVLVHWRRLSLLGIFLSMIQIFLPLFWVESPHWLAMKGRFLECEEAFKKLHGNGYTSVHELDILVKTEKNKQKAAKEMNTKHTFRKLLMTIKRRYFWDLMLLTVSLYIYYAAAGKMAFISLATVILKEITGASDVLWFTLVVDGFTVVGGIISCIFLKKTTIRVMLFSSGLTAIGILLLLSACLYFKNTEIYFQWINVALLAFYFIVVHVGPYTVIEVLASEIYPLELKLYCYSFMSPCMVGSLWGCVFFTPLLANKMGYHGLFLLNSGIMLACLAYLYAKLPETKGKTLQEIEVYFKTKKYDIDEVLSNNEQLNRLI